MSETDDVPDEELVRRVRQGDEAAARALFARHAGELRERAQLRLPATLRGRLAASDVMQEAYLAAFLALGDFEDRGDGSFAAWLRKILEHRITNAVRDGIAAAKRDARRQVPIPTDTRGAGPDPGQASPSEDAMASEDAALLAAARACLAPDHATVISLVHDEGLTLVAAGVRMGRSPDAARKLYARAMADLGARLRAARESCT